MKIDFSDVKTLVDCPKCGKVYGVLLWEKRIYSPQRLLVKRVSRHKCVNGHNFSKNY